MDETQVLYNIPYIPVKITNIVEGDFSYFEETLLMDLPILQLANICFDINRVEDNYDVIVNFNYKLAKEDKPLLKIQLSCHFAINKEIGDKLLYNEGLLLPKEYIKAIVINTISTTRGILYANTKHTEFNKYIIPSLEEEINFSEHILIPLVPID